MKKEPATPGIMYQPSAVKTCIGEPVKFRSGKDQTIPCPTPLTRFYGTGEAFRHGGLNDNPRESPWIDVLVQITTKIFTQRLKL